MDSALIFSWSRAQPGRESKALEVLAEAQVFWAKLAAEGKVSEPELMMSVDHNMFIIRGELNFLFQTLHTDEVRTLTDKAAFVASGFSYHFYSTASGSEHELELYAAAGTDLGYL